MLSELVNPIHFFIAFAPLAAYLILLGAINLRSRPVITTGTRDAAALGIGLGGLLIVGPLQLLTPAATWFRLGALTWLLLAALYLLLLSLALLFLRPRLVIYNIQADRVSPLLSHLVNSLDDQARWAGNCLLLPRLGVQLHIETTPSLRHVQLIAAGPEQSFEGWRRLHSALVVKLPESTGLRNPFGFNLIFCGFLTLGIVAFWFAQDPAAVAQSVQEILRNQNGLP